MMSEYCPKIVEIREAIARLTTMAEQQAGNVQCISIVLICR
jgi:hypothetical protein